MVEHDYYKLMQLDAYVSINEIKKRYHELAFLYHPDKNPSNKDAEEYFKIITQGYTFLSDKGQKETYDIALQSYYGNEKKNRRSNDFNLFEKIKFNRERKRKNTIKTYLDLENTLAFKYRYLIGILTTLFGFLIIYNHWFINHLSYDALYNLFCIFIFNIGCIFFVNCLYKKASYKAAITLINTNYERQLNTIFLLLFVGIPVCFIVFSPYIKKYHLNNFANYTYTDKIEPNGSTIWYEYTVDGIKIGRREDSKSAEKYQTLPPYMMVKYSRINPNISTLVLP